MEKLERFWQLFHEIQSEDAELAKLQLYSILLRTWLLNQTGLDRLDKRLGEEKFPQGDPSRLPAGRAQKSLGLQFLDLYFEPHVERLSGRELLLLETCLENRAEREPLQNAAAMVENTALRVLQILPGHPEQSVEILPSLDGHGWVPGNTIPFVLLYAEAYDEKGNFVNKNSAAKRARLAYSAASQLEPILARALKTPARVIVEVQ